VAVTLGQKPTLGRVGHGADARRVIERIPSKNVVLSKTIPRDGAPRMLRIRDSVAGASG
jgi:hypothetical protein